MTLLDFQKEFSEEILKQMPESNWQNNIKEDNKEIISLLSNKEGRKPFSSQLEHVIAPQIKSLNGNNNVAIINGSMGTGKTTMSFTIAYLLYKTNPNFKKGLKCLFLASGSKHLNKMKREAEEILPMGNVYVIVNKPRKSYHNEITMEEAIDMPRNSLKIFIMSKDSNKSSYKIRKIKTKVCPKCDKPLGKKPQETCSSCGEKLYNTVGGKKPLGKILVEKMKEKKKKLFDILIVDEVHEFGNSLSLQSRLYNSLIKVSYKKIIMSGTLSNGYASSVFNILFPLIPEHFKSYGFDHSKRDNFISLFGSRRESRKIGRNSRKSEELPKINDRIVSFLAKFTTWFSMENLNIKMPDMREEISVLPLDTEIEERFISFKKSFMEETKGLFFVKEKSYFYQSIKNKINNPTKQYVQPIEGYVYVGPKDFSRGDIKKKFSLYSHPEYFEKVIGNPIIFDSLDRDFRSNKENALISECRKEVSEGRRVLVYGVYNQSTSLYDRLEYILKEEGMNVGVMPDNLPSKNIEEFCNNFEGDILILPQKRVATGLDLVMFNSVIFYEISNEVRVVQQAKCRPWRPVGQSKEVRVKYLAFEGSQEEELKISATKMRAAAVVEGDLIEEDSIASIYDYSPETTAAIKEISQGLSSGEIEASNVKSNREKSLFELAYEEAIKEEETEVEETEVEVEIEVEAIKEAETEIETNVEIEAIKEAEVEVNEVETEIETKVETKVENEIFRFDDKGQGHFIF